MFVHPGFDPVIFHVAGPFSVRWYGLAYVIGFYTAWLLGCKALKKHTIMTKDLFSDLIFYLMLGVIFGGRIGYVLFYNFTSFFK